MAALGLAVEFGPEHIASINVPRQAKTKSPWSHAGESLLDSVCAGAGPSFSVETPSR